MSAQGRFPSGPTESRNHYHSWFQDGSDRVMFWQDGQLLFDVTGFSTRYSDGNCEWSVTNYSDLVDPDPTTVYVR